jgi:hypothetical protein
MYSIRAMQYSIKKTSDTGSSWVTYACPMFTMNICKSLGGQPHKSNQILTVFQTPVECIGIFVSRKEAPYALRKLRLAKKNA